MTGPPQKVTTEPGTRARGVDGSETVYPGVLMHVPAPPQRTPHAAGLLELPCSQAPGPSGLLWLYHWPCMCPAGSHHPRALLDCVTFLLREDRSMNWMCQAHSYCRAFVHLLFQDPITPEIVLSVPLSPICYLALPLDKTPHGSVILQVPGIACAMCRHSVTSCRRSKWMNDWLIHLLLYISVCNFSSAF